MYKIVVVLLLNLFISTLSYSQNVLEGAKGNSSIDYTQYGGGIVTLNAADKKLEIGYINYKFKTVPIQNGLVNRYSERPIWYGFTVSGKALNDYSTIFSNGKVSPASDIKIRFGYRIDGDPSSSIGNSIVIDSIKILAEERANPRTTQQRKNSIDVRMGVLTAALAPPPELWLITRGGYEVSKFKLYNQSLPFDSQFNSLRFDGFNGQIGLNYWHPKFNIFKNDVILLAGLTIGLRKQNNVDDLTEVRAEDVTISTNSITGTTRSFKSENVGFSGNYQTFTSFPINFDLYFKPHKLENAAFSLYGRANSYYGRNGSEMENGRQFPVNLGVGFYLLSKNWLANPLGGITLELSDSFQTLSADSFKDRLIFNIVTRVNIVQFRE
ncbi:hypothetical protein AHMF7616_01479 [Adhaeribacter pallidiroseus]|uniref:Uncharacterized protein n=2 Tax=Adhaeribacter pallidiroseus TaxID=2072847 RepID=A0A369QEZ4_9BACT|nr:hypothetical protein AHMF7616_01479 [Adhaeribacter pallidiroseus]